jgi:hypothetical protein
MNNVHEIKDKTSFFVSFLCGKIERDPRYNLVRGIIMFTYGEHLRVLPDDPGLSYIKAGKRRMVVVKDETIVAVFGKPRIKLLGMLERGAKVTQDLLDCYQPMYPKPEKSFKVPRTTYRWRGTLDQRLQKNKKLWRP